MNDGRLSRLIQAAASWPFVVSVSLLLLNDLHWKAAYSNWITGKLSDFAGLFFVSLLIFSAFPRAVYKSAALIAVGFAFWKSPLAQPLIDLVRLLEIARIGRVVDYSDLIALSAILLAYAVAANIRRYELTGPAVAKAIAAPILAVAFLATLGTTVLPHTERYSIRKADGYEPFDSALAARVIADVANKSGLKCTACDKSAVTAEYRGNGIWMQYWISDRRSILFSIEGSPGLFRRGPTPEMQALMRDLKDELGTRFNNMEFVLPLPERGR